MQFALHGITMLRLLLASFLFFVSAPAAWANNAELQQLRDADQASQMAETQDHKDDERRVRVLELIAAGSVVSPLDKANAAIVLQHTGFTMCDGKWKSISAENYLLAHLLIKSAIDSGLNGEEHLHLFAQTIDRYLAMTTETRRYGTNTMFDPETGDGYYPQIDRSISDEERTKYNVPSLKVLLARYPERGPSSN